MFSSSSSVYGDQPTLPLTEDMVPGPLNPYACQKFMGEIYARNFAHVYGLETVCLRYFNVYGPRQVTEGAYRLVIGIFMDQRRQGKPMTIQGDGLQTRDFTWVGDVVRASLLAAAVRSRWPRRADQCWRRAAEVIDQSHRRADWWAGCLRTAARFRRALQARRHRARSRAARRWEARTCRSTRGIRRIMELNGSTAGLSACHVGVGRVLMLAHHFPPPGGSRFESGARLRPLPAGVRAGSRRSSRPGSRVGREPRRRAPGSGDCHDWVRVVFRTRSFEGAIQLTRPLSALD